MTDFKSRYELKTVGMSANVSPANDPFHFYSAMPPRHADSIYVFSAAQERESGKTAGTFDPGDGIRRPFTDKVPVKQGANEPDPIEVWKLRHPDGVPVGYHSPATREFTAEGKLRLSALRPM
jgi:hypothetical protein